MDESLKRSRTLLSPEGRLRARALPRGAGLRAPRRRMPLPRISNAFTGRPMPLLVVSAHNAWRAAGEYGSPHQPRNHHNRAMTLTELRYIVAVARERHFGRAAEACFVSQPTLSVAIKKLEEELDVKIFERGSNEVSLTALGTAIVRQAQSVIEQAAAIKEIAKRGQDPLSGPLKLGIIYTIGPYLLPQLVRHAIELTPQMPLMLQENFTVKLLDMLRTGELDCAIMAEPFPDSGLAIAPLYDEPFVVAVPRAHRAGQGDVDLVGTPEAGDDAAAGHGPLLPRPRARGVPGVRPLLQRRRGHPQELRGLVAGDHQAHGGLGHGRDGGAAAVHHARHGRSRSRTRWSPTSRSRRRCPRAASCSPGDAASRATRRSPRFATPSTRARSKA